MDTHTREAPQVVEWDWVREDLKLLAVVDKEDQVQARGGNWMFPLEGILKLSFKIDYNTTILQFFCFIHRGMNKSTVLHNAL